MNAILKPLDALKPFWTAPNIWRGLLLLQLLTVIYLWFVRREIRFDLIIFMFVCWRFLQRSKFIAIEDLRTAQRARAS